MLIPPRPWWAGRLVVLTAIAWIGILGSSHHHARTVSRSFSLLASCLSSEINDQALCRTSTAAESFYNALWGCDFEERDIFEVLTEYRMANLVVDGKLMAGQNPYDGNYSEAHQDIDITDRKVKICNGADRWTFFMIGPDVTTGGEVWFEFQGRFLIAEKLAALAPNLRTHPDTPGWYAFEKFFVGSVDAGMTQIVGYPPIHVHHFHFFGDANSPQKAPPGLPWVESFFNMTEVEPWYTEVIGAHSDNECMPEQGGTDCFVRGAGAGTAWYAHDNLGMWSSFNDLRRAGAQPLKTWTTVALQVADPAHRRLLSIREEFVGIFPNNSPEIMQTRATYVVPIDQECVMWAYIPLEEWIPMNSTMIEGWFHTHDVEDVWVLEAGDPSQVFADVPTAMQAQEKLMCFPGSIKALVENVQARQLQPSAAEMKCSFQRDVPMELVDLHEDGNFVPQQRQGRCTLDTKTPGYFVLAFHPQHNPSPLTPWRHELRMHSLVRIYYSIPLETRPRVSWDAALFPKPPPSLAAVRPPSPPVTGLVPPMIDDGFFLSHPISMRKSGWSDSPLFDGVLSKRGAFTLDSLPDLTGDETCRDKLAFIDHYGINGYMESLPEYRYALSHPVGEIVMAYAFAQNITLEDTLLQQRNIASIFLTINTMGAGTFHGALWYSMAAIRVQRGEAAALQAIAELDVCNMEQMYLVCYHGIGHTATISAERIKDVCVPQPKHYNRSLIFDTVNFCTKIPTVFGKLWCGHGAYHAVEEYYDPDGRMGDGPLYPCDVSRFGVINCFLMYFCSNGFVRWRYDKIAAIQGHVSRVCTAYPSGMRESNVRACIFGLSAVYFPLFDRVSSPANKPFSGGSMDRHCQSYSSSIYIQDLPISGNNTVGRTGAHCNLLFSADPPDKYTNTTLVDWCSRIVPPTPESGADELMIKRWMACVVGSLYWTSPYMAGLYQGYQTYSAIPHPGEPVRPWPDNTRWCPQVLSVTWQSLQTRQRVYKACMDAGSDYFAQGIPTSADLDSPPDYFNELELLELDLRREDIMEPKSYPNV